MTEQNPKVPRVSRVPAEAIQGLLIDTSPYLSCDECFERLDVYVEQTIADPAYQDLPMQVHLHGCGACEEEARALGELLGGRGFELGSDGARNDERAGGDLGPFIA